MNDSVQVNQVYLIFNRPQFLVDSSESFLSFKIEYNRQGKQKSRKGASLLFVIHKISLIRKRFSNKTQYTNIMHKYSTN